MCALTKIAQLTSVSPVPETRSNLCALSFYFILFPQLLEVVSRNTVNSPLCWTVPLLCLHWKLLAMGGSVLCQRLFFAGNPLSQGPCSWPNLALGARTNAAAQLLLHGKHLI